MPRTAIAFLLVTSSCLLRDFEATSAPDGDSLPASGDPLPGDTSRPPVADPPPDPVNLSATPLSATRIRLSWSSGGGTTTDFRLAYRNDGVAPATCNGAVPETEIYGTTYDVRGLDPDTRYDFRVCAINANAPPDSSVGVTTFATTPAAPTLPPCDVTVAAGDHTTGEFQSVLDQAVADGDGGDGTIAVCLEDGVIIGTEGGAVINIPGDDIFIFAHDGDDARFDNPSESLFTMFDRTGFRLHNLTLRPSGFDAVAIDAASSGIALLSNLYVDIDGGNGAVLDAQWGTTVDEVVGIEAVVQGGNSVGISVSHTSSIGSIADTRITTFDRNIGLLLTESSSVGIIQSTTITTGGPGAHGIVLRENSHVDAASGVTLRRLGATGAASNTYAIVCDDALGAGGNEYFATSAIHDVTICSTFDETTWTAALANTSDGSLFVEPTMHVAYAAGGRGTASFPFDDSFGSTAGTDQQITMSAACLTGPPATEVVVSSSMSFAEFQTVLNDAWAAGDLDDDGLITVRIADGVLVRNDNALAHGRIVIPGHGFYIYADPGDTATFSNERTNGVNTDHGVLYSVGMHNLSLSNLTLRSVGYDGVVLETNSTFGGDEISSILLDHLTIQSDGERATAIVLKDVRVQRFSNIDVTTSGRYATPLQVGCSGHVNAIEDSTFLARGGDNAGVAVDCYSSVNAMRRVVIETESGGSEGLVLHKDSSISTMEEVSIRTAGALSHGLVLSGSSFVGAGSGVTIARAATATEAAVAILASPDQGANNYFDSADIVNVTICSESGALAWETGGFLLADGVGGGPWTVPAAHVPHLPGPIFGAQTFPFEDPAMTAQSIQFGGACP